MEDRVKYLESEFNAYYQNLREVSSLLYDFSYRDNDDSVDPDEKRFTEYWTHEYLCRMYNLLCVYFESLNLIEYLKEFKHSFGHVIKDKLKSIQLGYEVLQYGDTEEDLFLIIEWKKYLAPFNFFWEKQNDLKRRKIIEFLECTSEILKITNTQVNNEENINKIIRETAKFYFTGVTTYSEGYFVHQFKHYKPGVIIKEIGTAIEYKLIRSDKEVGIKLDELIVDAKRYKGNQNNRYCIAVFCLSRNVHKTKKEILEDWNTIEFPSNWHLIVISDIVIQEAKQKNNKRTKSNSNLE